MGTVCRHQAPDGASSRILWFWDYWTSLAGGMPPPRSAFDPRDLGALLPQTFLIEVGPSVRTARVRVAGDMFRRLMGVEATGKFVVELPLPRGDHGAFLADLRLALDAGAPVYREGPVVAKRAAEICARIETLLAPLESAAGSGGLALGLSEAFLASGRRVAAPTGGVGSRGADAPD